jgi:hypothetical protein
LITILFSLTILTLRSARSCVSRLVQSTACKRSLLLLVRLKHILILFLPVRPFYFSSSIVFLSFQGWQRSALSVGSIPTQPLLHSFLASLSPSSYIFISSRLHLRISIYLLPDRQVQVSPPYSIIFSLLYAQATLAFPSSISSSLLYVHYIPLFLLLIAYIDTSFLSLSLSP